MRPLSDKGLTVNTFLSDEGSTLVTPLRRVLLSISAVHQSFYNSIWVSSLNNTSFQLPMLSCDGISAMFCISSLYNVQSFNCALINKLYVVSLLTIVLTIFSCMHWEKQPFDEVSTVPASVLAKLCSPSWRSIKRASTKYIVGVLFQEHRTAIFLIPDVQTTTPQCL